MHDPGAGVGAYPADDLDDSSAMLFTASFPPSMEQPGTTNPQVPLTPFARARIDDAKDTLRRAGRPLDPGRIVAELSFGFWERLLTHGPPGKLNYEMALWRPSLHRAFPNSRRRRVDVHKPVPAYDFECLQGAVQGGADLGVPARGQAGGRGAA
jgi:hypothetical protein